MKAEILFLRNFLKVGYYTVQVINDDGTRAIPEFQDFQDRMSLEVKNLKQLNQLKRLIEKIGNYEGATQKNFRSENTADALPPNWFKFWDSDGIVDFGLRLYCIRVSDDIVILLNGDRKTTQGALKCPNCQSHFVFANNIAKSFYEAKNVDKSIEIDGMNILFEEEFYLNIPE